MFDIEIVTEDFTVLYLEIILFSRILSLVVVGEKSILTKSSNENAHTDTGAKTKKAKTKSPSENFTTRDIFLKFLYLILILGLFNYIKKSLVVKGNMIENWG